MFLKPLTLNRQLILTLCGLLPLAMASSLVFIVRQNSQAELERLQFQLQQNARSLEQALKTNDPFGVKNQAKAGLLLLAAEFPHVQQVDIMDRRGKRIVGALNDNKESSAYLILSPFQEQPLQETVQTDSTLVLWKNCDACGGWLRIQADTRYMKQQTREQIQTLLLFSLILIGLPTGAFFFNNRHISIQLKRIEAFTEQLAHCPGEQLEIAAQTQELETISQALNRLSKHWLHMRQLAQSSQFKLKMKNQILDEHAMVCITDLRGIIQDVNERFCQISQYPRKELIGQAIGMLSTHSQSPDHYKNLWRTLGLGRCWQGEFCNRKKSGELFWVSSSIVPISDEAGKVLFYGCAQTLIEKERDQSQKNAV